MTTGLVDKWDEIAWQGAFKPGAPENSAAAGLASDMSIIDASDLPENVIDALNPELREALRSARRRSELEKQADEDLRDVQAQSQKERQREEMNAYGAMAARISMTMDEWNSQTVNYGGLNMTRAKARQIDEYIVSHKDRVIEQGLASGDFRDRKEGESFIKTVKQGIAIDSEIQRQILSGQSVSKETIESKQRNDEQKNQYSEVLRNASAMRNDPRNEIFVNKSFPEVQNLNNTFNRQVAGIQDQDRSGFDANKFNPAPSPKAGLTSVPD